VKVDNLSLQRQQLTEANALAAPPVDRREPGTALVAVAVGAGFREIFASLGASVVDGGSAMNASVQEISAAIAATKREDVALLPNDPNVEMAAREAARLAAGRSVEVIPTRSMPQGIAAALALNPDAPVAENLDSLAEAAHRCHTIALTHAAR